MPNKVVLLANIVPNLKTNEEGEEYMIRHHYPVGVIAAVGPPLSPMSFENARGRDTLSNAFTKNKVPYVVFKSVTGEEFHREDFFVGFTEGCGKMQIFVGS